MITGAILQYFPTTQNSRHRSATCQKDIISIGKFILFSSPHHQCLVTILLPRLQFIRNRWARSLPVKPSPWQPITVDETTVSSSVCTRTDWQCAVDCNKEIGFSAPWPRPCRWTSTLLTRSFKPMKQATIHRSLPPLMKSRNGPKIRTRIIVRFASWERKSISLF